MTKHRTFGATNLRQSKKITQPLVETFGMSGSAKHLPLPLKFDTGVPKALVAFSMSEYTVLFNMVKYFTIGLQ